RRNAVVMSPNDGIHRILKAATKTDRNEKVSRTQKKNFLPQVARRSCGCLRIVADRYQSVGQKIRERSSEIDADDHNPACPVDALGNFHHLPHVQLRTQRVEILYVNLQSVFNMVGNATLVAYC